MSRNPRDTAERVPCPDRQAAAFLMLVVAILLAVVAAAGGLVRSELRTRRAQQDQASIEMLQTAIDASQRLSKDRLTLPLDPAQDDRIEITSNADRTSITARRIHGTKLIDQLTRSNRTKVEQEQ